MKPVLRKLSALSDSQWLAGIVCIGVFLRLAAILSYSHAPESDEAAYLDMAKNLVAGIGLKDGMGNWAFYNMGYPFFVLAPIIALFDGDIFAMRIGNLVLSAVTIVLVHAVAREARLGKPARILATALWALYLPSAVYGVYLAKENLLIPLMLCIIWCALRMLRDCRPAVALVCGLLFGLVMLVGNVALCLVAAVVVALLVSDADRRSRLMCMPVALAVAVLVTTPWLARNMHVVGAPVLNTNGGFNFYLGNNPNATGMFISIQETPRGPNWFAFRDEVGERRSAEILKREANEWIAGHPKEFVALAIRKFGLFWKPPLHAGKNEGRTEEAVRIVWLIQYLMLVGSALLALRHVPGNRPLAVLWVVVITYSAVHMLFYVIFRYREPVMPVLCILAAVALEGAMAKAGRLAGCMPDGLNDPENPVQAKKHGLF